MLTPPEHFKGRLKTFYPPQKLNRCYVKAAHVLHWFIPESRSRRRSAAFQTDPGGLKEGLGENELKMRERGGSQTVSEAVDYRCGKNTSRRAAELMQAEPGWEQQALLCERKPFYHMNV